MSIHKKNRIHHNLHSGNIFSYNHSYSVIGDLGLCQQVIDGKDDPDKIYGIIPYLAPEVLSKETYTKKSDIYSFGMIMWEHTTGRKPFYNKPHDDRLILDILKGKRPRITNDTPEFYIKLMKRCWDHNPENRPTANQIMSSIGRFCLFNVNKTDHKIIESAETERQNIIKTKRFLLNTKHCKYHPESLYISCLLNEPIQHTLDYLSTKNGPTKFLPNKKKHKHYSKSFHTTSHPSSRLTQQIKPLNQTEPLNPFSAGMGLETIYIKNEDDDNNNFLSDEKNHPGSSYTDHLSSGLSQQIRLLNLSSTGMGLETCHVKNEDDDNNNFLSNEKNHPRSSCTDHLSSGLTQQLEPLNFSSTGMGLETYYIKNEGDDNKNKKNYTSSP